MAASFTKSAWFQNLAVWTGTSYIKLCFHTSRFQWVNEEVARSCWDGNKPFIGAFWHGRLLMMPYGWRTEHSIHVLISRHGDGELIARVMNNLKLKTIRGSSAADKKKRKDRGGAAAMRSMVKMLEAGEYVAITPDGPKGPRMRAKDGAIALAKMSGAPIIAASSSTAPRKLLKSWDRFMLALPFSRGVIIWGNPIHVPADADDALMEQKRLDVEVELNRITEEADRMMGKQPVEPGKARFKKARAPSSPEGDNVSNNV